MRLRLCRKYSSRAGSPRGNSLALPGGRWIALDIRFHRIAQESPAFVFLVDVGLGNSPEHAFAKGQRGFVQKVDLLIFQVPGWLVASSLADNQFGLDGDGFRALTIQHLHQSRHQRPARLVGVLPNRRNRRIKISRRRDVVITNH